MQVPVVVGGIIPEADVDALREAGVAAVYTPKDFDLNRIMRDIVELVAEHARGRRPRRERRPRRGAGRRAGPAPARA